MPEESKRLLIAVFLCLGILFLWQKFFAPPVPAPHEEKPAVTPRAAAKTAVLPAALGSVESTTTYRARRFQATLSSRGGALKSVRLLDARFRELRDGHDVPIDLVQAGLGLPLEIALEGPLAIDRAQPWRLTRRGPGEFEMTQASSSTGLVKRLRFVPDGWLADLGVRVENRTSKAQPVRLVLQMHGRQAPDAPQPSMRHPGVRVWQAACHANGKIERHGWEALKKEERAQVGEVLWAGIEDKYFLLAAVPVGEKQSLRCVMQAGDDGALLAAVSYAERTVAPGAAEQYRFGVYLGPKFLEDLDAVTSDGKDVGLGDAVDYGRLRLLCRPMIWLLKWLQRGVRNWGVAIILLTIVVKLLTLYWTQKSMRSMRRMAQVGPEIQKLRDKYKDQKDRLNQEVMALYKRHNINPLGGCLPMLLQMPVWIALYTTISMSVELYRSPLALWISDLSAPDPYYVFPIVLAGLTFLQTKMTPTPSQDAQAKMMTYMMPGMFLFFSLFVPSGLTLYWLVNTLLGMLHQYWMNRRYPLAVLAPAKAGGRG